MQVIYFQGIKLRECIFGDDERSNLLAGGLAPIRQDWKQMSQYNASTA